MLAVLPGWRNMRAPLVCMVSTSFSPNYTIYALTHSGRRRPGAWLQDRAERGRNVGEPLDSQLRSRTNSRPSHAPSR